MKIMSEDEIKECLNATYASMTAPIKLDNVESLRNRLVNINEELPFAARIRADAEYWLDFHTEREALAILSESPKMSPSILQKVIKGRLAERHRVFTMARKLHEDLAKQSAVIITLISYEKDYLRRMGQADQAGRSPQARRTG